MQRDVCPSCANDWPRDLWQFVYVCRYFKSPMISRLCDGRSWKGNPQPACFHWKCKSCQNSAETNLGDYHIWRRCEVYLSTHRSKIAMIWKTEAAGFLSKSGWLYDSTYHLTVLILFSLKLCTSLGMLVRYMYLDGICICYRWPSHTQDSAHLFISTAIFAVVAFNMLKNIYDFVRI